LTDGEVLKVQLRCLMFFIDETGHEELADPSYPVFGIGGCAVMAGALNEVLREPWRALKEAHFGGANAALHAADLHEPTQAQLEALASFFAEQPFGRFAVVMTERTDLPRELRPYNVMPNAVRRRWSELASRCDPPPEAIALLHEASERGDELVEHYFGTSVAHADGRDVPVEHGFIRKSVGDEAMEVADFVAQAAGRQAYRWAQGDKRVRKDFAAIFRANPLWSSFLLIGDVRVNV